jgi:hypothetical protein
MHGLARPGASKCQFKCQFKSSFKFQRSRTSFCLLRFQTSVIFTRFEKRPSRMTAQTPDRIRFRPGGATHPLCENPLDQFLRARGLKKSRGRMMSTANWRGYVATWLLHGDRLWLTNVSSNGSIVDRRRSKAKAEAETEVDVPGELDGRPFSVDGLFPDEDRPPETPVFAKWYSGELRIPEGEMLRYVHGGYGTTYERDRLILIQRGRLVRSWVRRNDPPPSPEEQLQAFKERQALRRKLQGKRDANGTEGDV